VTGCEHVGKSTSGKMLPHGTLLTSWDRPSVDADCKEGSPRLAMQ
jgi:hypothetical protein